MQLRFEEHDSLGAVNPAQWCELVRQCSDATVFQTLEWLSAWWDSFHEDGWRIRLFAAYRGERVVALAPCYERPHGQAKRPSLHFIGEEHADYSTFIVADDERAVLAPLLNHVVARVDCTSIVLDEIPESSGLHVLLSEACAASPLAWARTQRTPCPRIALRANPTTAERLLKKQSLRRHRAALSKQGPLAVTHTHDRAVITRHLPLLFKQHIERWATTPHPSLFHKAANRKFYERLAEQLGTHRTVLFSMLKVADHPVAFHYGFVSHRSVIWYKPSFDVQWARYSPGEVMLGALIEYACAHDLDLDFTRGAESFKARFASHVAYNSSYVRLPSRKQALMLHLRRIGREALRPLRKSRRFS